MDIKTILQMLADDGLTDQEIGTQVGAAQSIITRLRNGEHKSTSWERGEKIRVLAQKRGLITTPRRRREDQVATR
jgi:hypothetical protein